MSINARILLAAAALGLMSGPLAAQDRPFLFSVSPTDSHEPHVTMHVDMAVGERAFDLTDGNRPEQRVGIQAALGRGMTLLARVGMAVDPRDTRSSQQAELLFNVLQRPALGTFAVGMGMRHESGGVNVLTGRLAAGRRFAAWRLDANAVFEKPFSAARDPVDLVTTLGIARRLSSVVYLGIEGIGEDLEGFWEPEEAEGGARVFVGPSLRVAPPAQRWQISVAGGPMLHATRSDAASDAARRLPDSRGRSGYAVKAALGYAF